jgi:hypothetical protein
MDFRSTCTLLISKLICKIRLEWIYQERGLMFQYDWFPLSEVWSTATLNIHRMDYSDISSSCRDCQILVCRLCWVGLRVFCKNTVWPNFQALRYIRNVIKHWDEKLIFLVSVSASRLLTRVLLHIYLPDGSLNLQNWCVVQEALNPRNWETSYKNATKILLHQWHKQSWRGLNVVINKPQVQRFNSVSDFYFWKSTCLSFKDWLLCKIRACCSNCTQYSIF